MSWMQRLYETYQANIDRPATALDAKPLLPVSHTLQQAHVEVVLDGDGRFLRASVIDPTDTIVPATEDSSGRTTNDAPHALNDKIQYVAGDYAEYGGRKKQYFKTYLEQLDRWSAVKPHAKTQAVLRYVTRRCVVADLIAEGILHKNEEGCLLTSWSHDSKPPRIFRVLVKKKDGSQDQGDAFVRWRVETPGEPLSATWEDVSLWQSWIAFDTGNMQTRGLCMVTGVNSALAQKHPAKLRNGKDGAKLVSSNDESGYTFRGRFLDSAQAAGIGSEVTQKAHSALRWLIGRQSYRHGSQVIVAWAVSGKHIPDPLADSEALFSDPVSRSLDTHGTQSGSVRVRGDAGQAFALRLSKIIAGYRANLGPTDDIVVMGLDSATPGRMAVTFYRELTGSEFIERIEEWHARTAWFQNFSKELKFVGAPAPKDIAAAAFGRRLDDKLSRTTVERLLPCIIDGRQLPRDLIEASVRRASHRAGMDWWEWERTLGIACSLFRGFHKEMGYSMALEYDRTTRDYLYGRLLAIAERIEERALYLSGEKRDTTAGRLMQRFADRPYSTWLNIEKGLQPYRSRLQVKDPGFLGWIMNLLDEVHVKFDAIAYKDDRPLSGEYLLGYHCQRRSLHEFDSNESSHDDVVGNDCPLSTEGRV